ncbi:MAG TPA: hypothetical protein VHN99_07285, partial [Deinococcales bacterium]|nr:hypothetical protein [Deinococcales bacterium]
MPLGSTRAANRRAILDALRAFGPSSRARLATLTGLSPAAVSGLTGELLGQGIVLEEPGAAGAAGRPPVLVSLNARAGAVLGLKLMEDRLQAVVTDLSAAPLAALEVPLPGRGVTPAAVVQAVQSVLAGLRESAGGLPEVLGVGLAVPGVIDHAAGV